MKVRLKRFDIRQTFPLVQMFQFHEGPIKTGGGKFEFEVREQFQFHEGPIKTIWPRQHRDAERRFNSMKVRLKQASKPASLPLEEFQFHEGPIKTTFARVATTLPNCFNSMKVRLKPRRDSAKAMLQKFQFHEGPIKTRYVHCLVVSLYVSIPWRSD